MSAGQGRRGTVAFDIIGTCFSLDPVREVLSALGAPVSTFDTWFAQTLRDAFALSLAGAYRPLNEMLAATLPRSLSAVHGLDLQEHRAEEVLDAFAKLPPRPDLQGAVESLSAEGWRIVALTNSSEQATRRLLDGAGLESLFAAVLSCDSVRKTKPHPDVYRMVREIDPGTPWLVAAHGWDTAGASLAGLQTIWISGVEGRYLATYPPPTHTADDLQAAATILNSIA